MSGPSLVLRFVKDQFDDYRESTIGGQSLSPQWEHDLDHPPAAFLTQTVTLDDNSTVKFEIWCAPFLSSPFNHIDTLLRDTAGQERYKVCSPHYPLTHN